MFRVMSSPHPKQALWELDSLELARAHARDYSRSLSRWMDEDACWVKIRDVNGVVIEEVNAFKPGRHRP